MRLAVRFAVAVICLVALVGLGVHYGATYDRNWPHPTGDQLQADYDASVGDRVLLFGDVRTVDGETNTIVVHVTDSADAVAAELTVRGVDEQVAPGGTVQIVGVLEADRTMTADRTVVVNRDPSGLYAKLGTSVVGVLLAVGCFVRYWRPTVHRVGFEPRSRSNSQSQDQQPDDSRPRDQQPDDSQSRDQQSVKSSTPAEEHRDG